MDEYTTFKKEIKKLKEGETLVAVTRCKGKYKQHYEVHLASPNPKGHVSIRITSAEVLALRDVLVRKFGKEGVSGE
jgi:hypothetical protein